MKSLYSTRVPSGAFTVGRNGQASWPTVYPPPAAAKVRRKPAPAQRKLPPIRGTDPTAAAVQEATSNELEARRRLVQLRREAARSNSEAALLETLTRRQRVAAEMRDDLDMRRGTKLSRAFGDKVQPATKEEVAVIAELLIGAHTLVEPDPLACGWFKLYRHLDRDGNGRLEYDELLHVIREQLKVDASTLPNERIQAFWLAIDTDQNGCVSAGEFGKMMRLGQQRIDATASGATTRRHSKAAGRLTLSRQRREEAQEQSDYSRRLLVESINSTTERLADEAGELERRIAGARARTNTMMARSRSLETTGQLRRTGSLPNLV